MQSYTIGKLKFRVLYPDLVRPLTPTERQGLKDDIEARGKVVVPVIVDGDMGIIDGGNRAAIAHELKLGDLPFEIKSGLSDEEKRDLAVALNVHRRQLTVEEQQAAHQARKVRIVEKRIAGESIRSIAESEGVSKAQVERDLKDTTVPGGTVVPTTGKVVGRDGVERPATMPKEEATVPGGTVADDEPAPDVTVEDEPEEPEEESLNDVDSAGNIVPPYLADVFAERKAFRVAKKHITDALALCQKLAKGPAGFYLAKSMQELGSYLKNAKVIVRTDAPYGVCPYCNAQQPRCKDCLACKGNGWVVKMKYDTKK